MKIEMLTNEKIVRFSLDEAGDDDLLKDSHTLRRFLPRELRIVYSLDAPGRWRVSVNGPAVNKDGSLRQRRGTRYEYQFFHSHNPEQTIPAWVLEKVRKHQPTPGAI